MLTALVLTVYAAASLLLVLYGLNAYLMILFSAPSFRAPDPPAASETGGAAADWPAVTVQVPLYNERNVSTRILDAVAALDYPADRLAIQVLDDSTDDTVEIVDQAAERIRARGVNIRVVRRTDRSGFKAGALQNGMAGIRDDFVAVFDADFIPAPGFLKQMLPSLLRDENAAFAQARWGHINAGENSLTLCQSLGIDGHFLVEQPARAQAGLFMNFNGTAGVWRTRAIREGGGWSSRTLTEDLDLSYRVQLAGWKACYRVDVEVPAELPATITGVKSQQFRWAKGSMQTSMLVLPRVWKGPFSLLKKVEAFLHLTNYGIHPLILLLSLLVLPVLAFDMIRAPAVFFLFAAVPLLAATLGPSAMYTVAVLRNPCQRRSVLLRLPLLIVYGTGIAVSNSIAIYEALTGKAGAFVRTPKKGARMQSGYRLPPGRVWILEVFLGLYSAGSVAVALCQEHYGVLPFLALYCGGFLTVGVLSYLQMRGDA